MGYKVKINAFEGPLDLLLHLVKQLEIDIYDIPVAEITEQYLDYIHLMQDMELDIASEYLVMAATLIEMKSRMLLPKPELEPDEFENGYDTEEDDPREELIRQLVEYRQYKQLADTLQERSQNQSLYYYKPVSHFGQYRNESFTNSHKAVYSKADLLTAIQKMTRKRVLRKTIQTRIDRRTLPIGTRMVEIIDILRDKNKPLTFKELFDYPDRTHVIVTFLAILELMKNKHIFCAQEDNFNEIMITKQDGVEEIDTNELDNDY